MKAYVSYLHGIHELSITFFNVFLTAVKSAWDIFNTAYSRNLTKYEVLNQFQYTSGGP